MQLTVRQPPARRQKTSHQTPNSPTLPIVNGQSNGRIVFRPIYLKKQFRIRNKKQRLNVSATHEIGHVPSIRCEMNYLKIVKSL
jgi:hypothetical protein